VWELNLFGAVLPAVVLLLLMALAVERVCPGYGAATAVLLGAGTMLLPFATLFYDQALSAALGFAAFVVLLRERDGPARTTLVAAAGMLTGLAVVAEFPLALFGSATRTPSSRRVGAGAPEVGSNDDGFSGVGLPDPRAALSLLASETGLLIVAPIAIGALFGRPLLWRSGRRAETLVCAGVAATS
jgi:hypothetical protein